MFEKSLEYIFDLDSSLHRKMFDPALNSSVLDLCTEYVQKLH